MICRGLGQLYRCVKESTCNSSVLRLIFKNNKLNMVQPTLSPLTAVFLLGEVASSTISKTTGQIKSLAFY